MLAPNIHASTYQPHVITAAFPLLHTTTAPQLMNEKKFLQDDLDRLWGPQHGPSIRAIAHPSRENVRATPRLRDLSPPPAAVGCGAGACRVLLAVGPEGGWDVRMGVVGTWVMGTNGPRVWGRYALMMNVPHRLTGA